MEDWVTIKEKTDQGTLSDVLFEIEGCEDWIGQSMKSGDMEA